MFRFAVVLLCTLLLACACTGGTVVSQEGLRLEVFAVGKADAMLLSIGGANVLIDTGEDGDGKEIVDLLQKRGVEKIDLLILTHFDKDHIGGADVVLQKMPVTTVRLPNYESDSEQYAAMTEALAASSAEEIRMTEDASFTLGGAEFTMWVSDVKYKGDNDNEQSLVTKVAYGGKTYLFMGDAEGKWLKHLCFGTYNLTCDVLKMPHHGRDDDNTLALLTVALPTVAIVTDSEKNPASENTLSLLETFASEVYRTAVGSVLITQDGTEFHAGYTE